MKPRQSGTGGASSDAHFTVTDGADTTADPFDYGGGVFPQHAAMLRASKIDRDIARERGTVSVDTKATLAKHHIAKAGRIVPGLLLPVHGTDGVVSCQYRPDEPRLSGDGKPVKYETPYRQPLRLDMHPRTHPHLGNPEIPLFITEGIKKVDALLSTGAKCVIGLLGVWGWRGTNSDGGKVALPDWHSVALNGRSVWIVFDHDVMRKKQVKQACQALAGFLRSKGADVEYLWLPAVGGDQSTGVDDYLAGGGTIAGLLSTSTRKWDPPELSETEPGTAAAAAPKRVFPQATREDVHQVFRKWFGPKFDLQYLDIVLAAGAASMRLDGPPLWLQIIGGSGNAKTETASVLEAVGAIVVSTITGPAGLLSGTAKHERAKDATGGLLLQLGKRGTLVIKDFTSVLSMSHEKRAEVLAALRESYDGVYTRVIGSDGGRTLEWRGRIGVVSCVTGKYDEYYAVVAAMGERFLLLRVESDDDELRRHAGRQALRNGGGETAMKQEFADTAGGLLTHLPDGPPPLDDATIDQLVDLADVLSRARSQVARDFKGDPEYAHAAEMPTRVVQQLRQLIDGCRLIGMTGDEAMSTVRRVARDSIPPDRRAVLLALADMTPGTTTSKAIAAAVGMSRSKTDRTLRELALHRLVEHREQSGYDDDGKALPWIWKATTGDWLHILRGTQSGGESPPNTDTDDGTDDGTHSGEVRNHPHTNHQDDTDDGTRSGEVRKHPPNRNRNTATAPPDGEPAASNGHIDSGIEISDFSGTGPNAVDPFLLGPCVRCGTDTIRYGTGANPLCRDCQTAPAGAA